MEMPDDSTAQTQSSDTAKPKVKLVDSVHRQIRIGKKATYPFMPDSCFNQLVLGNPDSFRVFRLENGADMIKIGNDRQAMAWYNSRKTEELQVAVTGNEKKGFYPYRFVLQRVYRNGATLFPEKHEFVDKANFISGHGIYLGMSVDYVENVYQSQTVTQWQKGDTLYLQYNPEKKDEQYFTHYNYQSYSAIYKFVNDDLCRVEYTVQPENFEPTPEKD